MRRRLRVNPILCNGAGFCAEMFSERITLDDWGYPVISDEAIAGDELTRLANKTVRVCPRHALSLIDEPE